MEYIYETDFQGHPFVIHSIVPSSDLLGGHGIENIHRIEKSLLAGNHGNLSVNLAKLFDTLKYNILDKPRFSG